MAGDWIPISVDLPGKPEVAMLSRILGKSTDECLGMLIRFWIWCQAHTDDGNLSGMDTAMLTAVSHVPERFFGALQKVGWLEVTDSGCFIPNFERWFGGAAKRRLLEARKKRLQRANAGGERNGRPDLVPKLSRSCPDSVPNLSRAHRDKNGTRGEKRKEDINSPPLESPPRKRGGDSLGVDFRNVAFPPGTDTPVIRDAIAVWLDYRRRIGKPYKDPERQVSLLLREHGAGIAEAIQHSIANGYQGCFPPANRRDGSSRDGPEDRIIAMARKVASEIRSNGKNNHETGAGSRDHS